MKNVVEFEGMLSDLDVGKRSGCYSKFIVSAVVDTQGDEKLTLRVINHIQMLFAKKKHGGEYMEDNKLYGKRGIYKGTKVKEHEGFTMEKDGLIQCLLVQLGMCTKDYIGKLNANITKTWWLLLFRLALFRALLF